ncbi:uncharacterized protein [Garra rufa]|uniref:uncharacterized protein n=1 Tax=Garra rufa TaxID=137080 RepID=UPI003CCE9192
MRKMAVKLVLFCLCLWRLVGVSGHSDAEKSVSVMEGDLITLNSGLTETQTDDQIIWTFGQNNLLIAKLSGASGKKYYEVLGGRFRDRLNLDRQTGSLAITNTRTTDSGLYQITISGISETRYRFHITVYAHHLPVPVISRDCSSSSTSSSSSYCSVVCSVVNVSDVTLSWYEGNSLVSSISVSDLHISLSLPLEVEYEDKNTYSCVLTNSFTNQTQHLDISKLCQPCSARLPVPVISRDCSSSSSSSLSSSCSVVCSVVNVSNVTLSWYKGNSLLSSISVSDLSISLSLPLEVEYQDKNTYSCVLNNSFTNQTQHLDISKLCQPCSGVSGNSDEVKSVSVMEGESVTLNSGLTETQTGDLILWTFGPNNLIIAKLSREFSKMSTYNGPDGRFKDRLKVDLQTGSLTITKTRTTDSGLYDVTIIGNRIIKYRFHVTISGI